MACVPCLQMSAAAWLRAMLSCGRTAAGHRPAAADILTLIPDICLQSHYNDHLEQASLQSGSGQYSHMGQWSDRAALLQQLPNRTALCVLDVSAARLAQELNTTVPSQRDVLQAGHAVPTMAATSAILILMDGSELTLGSEQEDGNSESGMLHGAGYNFACSSLAEGCDRLRTLVVALSPEAAPVPAMVLCLAPPEVGPRALHRVSAARSAWPEELQARLSDLQVACLQLPLASEASAGRHYLGQLQGQQQEQDGAGVQAAAAGRSLLESVVVHLAGMAPWYPPVST